MHSKTRVQGTLAALLLLPLSALAASELDLAAAERLALKEDVTAPRHEALAEARREQAVAEESLPDPRLKLGALNLPTDSFSRTQEGMTQLAVGVQQAFPPGDTLRLRGQQAQVLARVEEARARALRLAVLRDARERFLDVYYQVEAGHIVDESRELFRQLLDITRAHYAAGRKNQQDVLRASVELGLLDDRRTRIRTAEERARAALARLIGQGAAYRPVARSFPRLPPVPDEAALAAAIESHPAVRAAMAQVEAGQIAVDVERQRYKPGWMLDLTYGNRAGYNPDGSERSDFLSAMVTVDLPLFTGNRQDRYVARRQKEVEAARLNRDDVYLRLMRQLKADHAEWLRLKERVALYHQTIVPEAEQNAEASLAAYQAGVTDFTGLMRARLTELDAHLTALRLRVDQAKAQARLIYLSGDDS